MKPTRRKRLNLSSEETAKLLYQIFGGISRS